MIEAFDPPTTIPLLQREGVTLAGAGTPFHMAYLAAQREQPDTPLFPNVRAFPGGGAPKPPQLHYDIEVGARRRRDRVGLRAHRVPDPHDGRRRATPTRSSPNTEGRATPGVEIKVVTLDGQVAGPDEEGEIRAKGPQLFRGYLDSSLDADAFDEEGFFRTGDLGKLDAEGYITITGRLKDVIIRKGENISAKEVEDLLFTSPAIADVAVIGLPDDRSGERACAIVVPADPGSAADAQGHLRLLLRRRAHDPEDPRAARDRRRPAPQRDRQGPQARAAQAVHGRSDRMPLPDELKELAQRLSNWGRWGGDDQRGTLNFITPEAVRRGVADGAAGRHVLARRSRSTRTGRRPVPSPAASTRGAR